MGVPAGAAAADPQAAVFAAITPRWRG